MGRGHVAISVFSRYLSDEALSRGGSFFNIKIKKNVA